MPRKPRFVIPGVPMHIVQRGHSREPAFFEDSDYSAYLGWLKEAADRYQCAIHAYVLMTNHVHILATPADEMGVARMMQYVGRRYVPYINYSYGTTGTLWEGRYKANLVQANDYLLMCMRYIELNPVRANMVSAPAHYRWSSYRANGQGKVDVLITEHPLYLALGRTKALREEAYKALFKAHVDDEMLDDIRCAWQSGTPLGNDSFRKKVEAKLDCRVGHAKRGRPSKIL
ncbi:MAG: transposase [Gammaproteobacteria bacterium]|nr:transposase [Gammaproteobacteria bacterium]